MGDTEWRLRGTTRLSVASDSHSDWLSWRRVFLVIADVGLIMDGIESLLRRMGGVSEGVGGVDLVSNGDELSRSGLGPDFVEDFVEVAVAAPVRDAIVSLRPFACVEAVSSPESEGGGGDKGLLLGCGSMLSRGGRK
jgi:hypothetical protein